jgi:hypothetical protein
MALPKDFNPQSFDSPPHPQANLFEVNQFPSASDHKFAEREAREQIIDALSKRYGQPCISQYDLANTSYIRKHSIKIEDIQSGLYKIV